MKIEELNGEEMYCLVAPDGSPQLMTLATDFPTCVAVIKMLHKSKMVQSFHELCVIGKFEILPVKITIIQNGDANKPFNKRI